jgi:hypothetical protein
MDLRNGQKTLTPKRVAPTRLGSVTDVNRPLHSSYKRGCQEKKLLPDQAALVQIEHVWLRAVEQHDMAALGCILADEFEEADFAGSLIDRPAMLASAANRATFSLRSNCRTCMHTCMAISRMPVAWP